MTYNNFNDVANPTLRTWNRCATMFNIIGDHGRKEATEYTAQFSAEDKQAIRTMFAQIRNEGYEKVRASVNRDVQKNVH